MAHRDPHPLARLRVVPDFWAQYGLPVLVVDWLDRFPEFVWLAQPRSARCVAYRRRAQAYRMRIRRLGLHVSGTVMCRSAHGLTLVHHAELPSYDPVPVGVIS